MFIAKQYRAKAAEYKELLKAARSPAETREFRRIDQSHLTLTENEEWYDRRSRRKLVWRRHTRGPALLDDGNV
jgi:hypothetical protein